MTSRFNDPTPFTPMSQLSPEAQEFHKKVGAAMDRYRQSGDPAELQKLGVLPAPENELEDIIGDATQAVQKMINKK